MATSPASKERFALGVVVCQHGNVSRSPEQIWRTFRLKAADAPLRGADGDEMSAGWRSVS
jgi:hypothetical protein